MELATYVAIKEIEIGPCRYGAPCSARRCDANATVIAHAFDTGGRPVRQYDLCVEHSIFIARRENAGGDPLCFCWNERSISCSHSPHRARQQRQERRSSSRRSSSLTSQEI